MLVPPMLPPVRPRNSSKLEVRTPSNRAAVAAASMIRCVVVGPRIRGDDVDLGRAPIGAGTVFEACVHVESLRFFELLRFCMGGELQRHEVHRAGGHAAGATNQGLSGGTSGLVKNRNPEEPLATE